MAKVKVTINHGGARSILNSSAVQGELLKRANSIKNAANSSSSGTFVADVRPGANRAHAMVKTGDFESVLSNAKHNTLLKSLGSGR